MKNYYGRNAPNFIILFRLSAPGISRAFLIKSVRKLYNEIGVALLGVKQSGSRRPLVRPVKHRRKHSCALAGPEFLSKRPKYQNAKQLNSRRANMAVIKTIFKKHELLEKLKTISIMVFFYDISIKLIFYEFALLLLIRSCELIVTNHGKLIGFHKISFLIGYN